MTPQIEIDSPLGKFLTEQAALASTIVEIGTGGGGSTMCLFKGLREGARLITVEADRNTYLVLASIAPIIESFLPEQIDLLLLDGGEFTTFGDYKLLKNRCKVIVIDDCNYEVALKTAAIYSILKSDPAWECIADHRLNRNGWAAFRRKGV
jgi:16S rRNA A1518/A1519 N6-dimethyltransferase RsmA/KsgA/DIM1 with predicted DNA glycosylase/AP lyase activity